MTAAPLVVLGTGRLGSALATSATNAGLAVSLHRGREGALVPACDGPRVWVLAVRDAVLGEVSKTLYGTVNSDDVVVHLAGMHGPSAVDGAGGKSVSSHPLAAVSSPRARGLREGAAFLLEGDDEGVRRWASMLVTMGFHPFAAKSVARPSYHGAAALLATGGVALAQGARDLFAAALGDRADDAFVRAAVASLLHSVADNVEADGVDAALASPLLRDDTATVAAHLTAMTAANPKVAAMYRAALARVLDTLAASGRVKAETITQARAMVET